MLILAQFKGSSLVLYKLLKVVQTYFNDQLDISTSNSDSSTVNTEFGTNIVPSDVTHTTYTDRDSANQRLCSVPRDTNQPITRRIDIRSSHDVLVAEEMDRLTRTGDRLEFVTANLLHIIINCVASSRCN